MIPKVEITKVKLVENYFIRDKCTWQATTLIEAAKDLPEFDMPLAGINLEQCWEIPDMSNFVHHMERVQLADDRYPIILGALGEVVDGLHRVAKAILAGKETIKAKRIQKMPEPDGRIN